LPKVVKFWPKHFWDVLMENDKKWTEKNVGMCPVKNQVILTWFSTLPNLVVSMTEKVVNFWPEVFLTFFYVKQPQINLKKRCSEVLETKASHFGLVCKFSDFSCQKVMKFWLKYFLAILIGNNNKMIKNYVGKVWVQNLVILGYWFLCWKSWNFDRNIF